MVCVFLCPRAVFFLPLITPARECAGYARFAYSALSSAEIINPIQCRFQLNDYHADNNFCNSNTDTPRRLHTFLHEQGSYECSSVFAPGIFGCKYSVPKNYPAILCTLLVRLHRLLTQIFRPNRSYPLTLLGA